METIQSSPTVSIDLTASLKACAEQRDLNKGRRLHADIIKERLLVTDACIGNTLISMYAKCEAIEKAHQIFDELPLRNTVSWNGLISAYTQQGHGEEALSCFQEMQLEDFVPDEFTVACVLKACARTGALAQGQKIHAYILRLHMLSTDVVVSTALVDMYIKCDALEKALEVFDEIQDRNVVSWNALMTGFLQKGLANKALSCFDTMQCEGVSPDAVTFVCALKACASIEDLEIGEKLSDEVMRKHGLVWNFVGNAIIDMYAKCGSLAKAREVFEKLPDRDTISWNTLIAGYAQQGLEQEALDCYNQMQMRAFTPDAATFASILQVCASIGRVDIGEEIHARIVVGHYMETHIVVATALVDMYAKFGLLDRAREVLDKVPTRDVVMWNALIGGCAQHGMGEEALAYMEMMQSEGFSPDGATFACALKACGSIKDLERGQKIHAQLVHELQMSRNVAESNALVDMYLKCNSLESAKEVFNDLQVRNVVTWNTLLAEYAEHEHCEEALKSFEQLKQEGLSPDSVTIACTLKACASMENASHGQRLHIEAVKYGFLETDAAVGTALVFMYASYGKLHDAQDVFENLSVRDIVSWNAIIGGYCQQELGEEALNHYEQMKSKGFTSTAVTYAYILKACGIMGAVCEGEKLHAEVVEHGLLEQNVIIWTALLSMYSNCCMLSEARDVFDDLPSRDVVSWGALMEGYSLLGEHEVVLDLYDEMIAAGVGPNWVTSVIILSVYSHRGLLDEGQIYLEALGNMLNLEQCACVIDMLGRAGHLENALAVVEEMPFFANPRLWNSLLGACLKWKNMALGKWVFQHMAGVGEDAARYVSLCNIFAAAGEQEDLD